MTLWDMMETIYLDSWMSEFNKMFVDDKTRQLQLFEFPFLILVVMSDHVCVCFSIHNTSMCHYSESSPSLQVQSHHFGWLYNHVSPVLQIIPTSTSHGTAVVPLTNFRVIRSAGSTPSDSFPGQTCWKYWWHLVCLFIKNSRGGSCLSSHLFGKAAPSSQYGISPWLCTSDRSL